MASLLNNIAGPMAAAAPSQGEHGVNGAVLSQDSTEVVSGLVEAFMHKVQLEPGERSCLENNVGQLTGDIMGTVGDVVTAVKVLISGKGKVAKQDTGSIVSAGMDSAMKITSLVGLSTQFIKNCVHGDALVLLNTTAQHLINATYLGRRFLANGVDIAHSLSDSVVAFEHHQFRRFGSDIGTSLRKILLSNATNGTRLPEGLPVEEMIQKATDGLMRGFFVSGSSVEITDTAQPDVDIVINLHQCIAGNSAFFKELWMAAWDLIAQLSMNGGQHGLGNPFQPQEGQDQPKWSGELMVAMMQFPMALSKCGVAQDMQTMLMEAIKTLSAVKVRFQFPDDRVHGEEAADKMAKAVEAWTNWNFEGFGYELGELFRELIMLAFPQKYSVDASGRLRRYSQLQASGAETKSGTISSSVIIGGAAVSVLVAFVVVRARRMLPYFLVEREQQPVSDIEETLVE